MNHTVGFHHNWKKICNNSGARKPQQPFTLHNLYAKIRTFDKKLKMEKQQLEILHNLTLNDKFELVQMVWDDIAKEQDQIGIPPDHQKILSERLAKIKSGKATFKPWSEIKNKYFSE